MWRTQYYTCTTVIGVIVMRLFVQLRQAVDTSPVVSSFYGQQLQQQQQEAGNLLHAHHHQYHQQRMSTVRDTFQSGRGDAITQFEAAAAGRRHMSSDAGVLGTSLPRSHQRQSGTSFATSRVVSEVPDHACVDRFDYVLLGCDQFAKIS